MDDRSGGWDVRNFYVVAAQPPGVQSAIVDPNGGGIHTFSVTDAVAQRLNCTHQAGLKLKLLICKP
jgi:hypothetical protein